MGRAADDGAGISSTGSAVRTAARPAASARATPLGLVGGRGPADADRGRGGRPRVCGGGRPQARPQPPASPARHGHGRGLGDVGGRGADLSAAAAHGRDRQRVRAGLVAPHAARRSWVGPRRAGAALRSQRELGLAAVESGPHAARRGPAARARRPAGGARRHEVLRPVGARQRGRLRAPRGSDGAASTHHPADRPALSGLHLWRRRHARAGPDRSVTRAARHRRRAARARPTRRFRTRGVDDRSAHLGRRRAPSPSPPPARRRPAAAGARPRLAALRPDPHGLSRPATPL